jgi:type IX secretion system PorP/SprF family membrane protein
MLNQKKIKEMRIKKNIIKGLVMLLIVVAGFTSKAQQDPMYTQYMFNTQTINPAYVGTWESIGFMALARQQWGGLEGAPQTYTFTIQAPLKNERVGLGLNLISDKVGLEKRFYMFGDYSYMLPVNKKSSIRLGLKGGFTNYTNDLSAYQTHDKGVTDPSFQGEINNKFMPNIGVGAFLYSKRYYVGFSIPKIVNNKFDNDLDNYSVESEMRHYYLTAGLVFDLGENIKFKPTMLTKATFSAETGAPVELDLTANFLIKEKFWLGAMYRSRDSFGFIVQWIFDEKLRIGYAYDIPTTNLHKVSSGSHEIMVSYELKSLKELVVSPRYF